MLANLDVPTQSVDCACQPCQVKRACLQKFVTLLASSSPELFEQVEDWAVVWSTQNGYDN